MSLSMAGMAERAGKTSWKTWKTFLSAFDNFVGLVLKGLRYFSEQWFYKTLLGDYYFKGVTLKQTEMALMI